jgi:hypothetical protein
MYGRAEPLLDRALRLTAQSQGQSNAYNAEGLGNLATDYRKQRNFLRESNAIARTVRRLQSDDYLISLHNLAGAQIDMGNLEGAARSDHEVLSIRQKIWGRDHPDTAYSLNNLGWIYLEIGRGQLTQPLLKENLAISRAPSAMARPLYVSSLANWGRVLEQKSDYSGAAHAFNQAMQLLASEGNQESWCGATIMDYQVFLDLDRSRYPDAVRLATRALQVDRNVGGDDNPQLSNGLLVLGLAQLLADNPSEAETSFCSALVFRQSAYPPAHPEVLLV